jgi:hypothetical protein
MKFIGNGCVAQGGSIALGPFSKPCMRRWRKMKCGGFVPRSALGFAVAILVFQVTAKNANAKPKADRRKHRRAKWS